MTTAIVRMFFIAVAITFLRRADAGLVRHEADVDQPHHHDGPEVELLREDRAVETQALRRSRLYFSASTWAMTKSIILAPSLGCHPVWRMLTLTVAGQRIRIRSGRAMTNLYILSARRVCSKYIGRDAIRRLGSASGRDVGGSGREARWRAPLERQDGHRGWGRAAPRPARERDPVRGHQDGLVLARPATGCCAGSSTSPPSATGCHACFIYFVESDRLVLRAASPRYSSFVGELELGVDEGLTGMGGADPHPRVHPRQRDRRPAHEVRPGARGGAVPVDDRGPDPVARRTR